MYEFYLNPDSIQQLERITVSSEATISRRAQIVLLYNTGLSTREVAERVGLSFSRTRYWRRQFILRGMAIFPALAPRPSPLPPPPPPLPTHPAPTSAYESHPTAPIQAPTSAYEPYPPGPFVLPLPQPLPAPGLLGEDTLAEAGRKTLLFHFAEMLSHEAGTRLGEDIEALHDMRVATRRMRAAFAVFEQAYKPKAIKPFLKGARAAGRALGRARDLDVLLDNLGKYIRSLPTDQQPGLQPLANAWQSERIEARQELIAHLDSDAFDKFKRSFNVFLQTPGAGALPPSPDVLAPSRVRDVVPVLIYTRLAVVHAYETLLPNATITQLHALRIEFKRFRYTVEFFREILGEAAKTVIEELKRVQDHLGELHDADVTCTLIQQFLADWEAHLAEVPLADRQSPSPMVAYLANRHAERYRLMSGFPLAWQHFRQPEFQLSLAQAIAAL